MRMRELEQRSGVGRETIRFYIREGLLPEPARAARNSASYSEAHVERLGLIKRLQEERFLPLAVIRGLLDGEGAAPWLEAQAFPGLDDVLRQRIDHDAPRVAAATIVAGGAATQELLDEAVANGFVDLAGDGTLTARDAAILKVLGDLDRIGFRRERGFRPGMVAMYRDLVDWMTAQEMRFFFEATAGQVGEDEAADMAARGIGAVNELIGLMRTKALLKGLAKRRAANDR
ncbi:MAG: MerR family transcriptional regulator [Sphingomonadaceae bacterium]|nr:MerR family transcriptional regulator [Sphingomonadaceae bacterium]